MTNKLINLDFSNGRILIEVFNFPRGIRERGEGEVEYATLKLNLMFVQYQ